LWYSINSSPISKSEVSPKGYLHPNLRDFIDTHFVWNYHQKLELEAQGAKSVLVKGSMVFTPLTVSDLAIRKPLQHRILFFEVAPHKEIYNGFYSTRSSMLTLSSLVKLRNLLVEAGISNLQIVVKPKRQYTTSIDAEYVELIKGLQDSRLIQLLKPECNLYEEISKADLVLAPPFSSPCVIAKEMQVPSYFYFLADSEWQLPQESHGTKVLRDFSQLVSVAKEYFKLS